MKLNDELIDGIKNLPTIADRFDAVADLFEKNQENRVIDMHNTGIDKGLDSDNPKLCYACIAGHLADIVSDGTTKHEQQVYYKGANLLSEMIFANNEDDIEDWACNNPMAWGNEKGIYALTSGVAYGFEDENDGLYFDDVIAQFRFVAYKLREFNKGKETKKENE